MAKFLKRIGTTAEKFALELNLDKVEMKLAKDTRVSLSFQRGDRKVETKNAPNLENGVAEFDESFIIPITFYHDKKKEKYLEKQGILTAFIITNKGPKKAGLTKFDLAEFLNNGTREKKEVIPILKCMDKNAKFHFTVKLTPFDELEKQLENNGDSDDSGDENSKSQKTEEISEDEKSVFSIKSKDLNKSGLTDNSSKSKDKNLKPKEERKDRSKSPGPEGSKNIFDTRKASDFSNPDAKESRPTANFFTKTTTGVSRSKNLDSSDDEESLSQTEKRAQTNKFKERIFDLEHQLNVSRMEKENFQRLCNELQAELQETKDELAESRKQNESITKLYERSKTMADSKKDPFKTGSSTIDTNVQAYKDKITQLEQEVASLKKTTSPKGSYKGSEYETKRYQELEAKYKLLEQELDEYKEKIEALESQSKKPVDKVSYEQFKKLNKEVAALKDENQDLKEKNEDLEETVKSLEAKLKAAKTSQKERSKSPDVSTDSSEYMDKFFELEKKYNQMEETYTKKITILEKESKYLKEQSERTNASASGKGNKQLEEDYAQLKEDNSQLMAEVDSLKKQLKDSSSKTGGSKSDNRQTDDLKSQIQTLEKTLKRSENELAETKVSLSKLKDENEKIAKELHVIENENIQYRVQITKLGDDLLTTKTNLGTVMNSIFEYGGPEMFDLIEDKISFGEKENE